MSPINRSMLEKYLRGECTPEEEQHVYHWFNLNDAADHSPILNKQNYTRKEKKIWKRLGKQLGYPGMNGFGHGKRYMRVAGYAAAAAVLLLCCWLFLSKGWDNRWREGTRYATAAGEIKRINLPDGSVVTLNALSSVCVSPAYGENERRIYLEGEAYFLVQKDTAHAFIVVANNVATTALGTIFNVTAWPGESETIVSLQEGKVSVNQTGDRRAAYQGLILEAGEEAICPGNGRFIKKVFDRKKRLSWKDQVIYFEQAGLPEVIRRLERHYGVNIDFSELEGEQWELTGEYRQVPLKTILESLAFSYGITYQIDGEHIVLSQKPN